MAGGCEDYQAWRLRNLSDPTEAAYFLLAALEDAIEMNLPEHFVKSVIEIHKINGSSENPFVYMLNHIKQEDAKTLHGMTTQIAGMFVAKAERDNSLALQHS